MKYKIKEKYKLYIQFVVAIILYYNIGNLFGLLLKAFKLNSKMFEFSDIAIGEITVSLLITIALIVLYKDKLKEDFEKFKANFIYYMKLSVSMFGVLFVIKIISSTVMLYLSLGLDIPINVNDNQAIIEALAKSAPLVMFFTSVLLAPFIEEVMFRLGLRRIIKDDGLFIIISGLTFGFLHVFPASILTSVALLQSIVYISGGIFLAYLYTKTNNIYVVILVHALNNLVGTLAVLFVI